MVTRQYHPNLDDAEALKTFRLIRRAADVIYECAASLGITIHEARYAAETKLYVGQTAHGAFLEFHNKLPWWFWTPWGNWEFSNGIDKIDSAEAKLLQQAILARLETSVPPPKITRIALDNHDMVYAILAVDGERLPKPKLVDLGGDIDIATAREGWEALLALS